MRYCQSGSPPVVLTPHLSPRHSFIHSCIAFIHTFFLIAPLHRMAALSDWVQYGISAEAKAKTGAAATTTSPALELHVALDPITSAPLHCTGEAGKFHARPLPGGAYFIENSSKSCVQRKER